MSFLPWAIVLLSVLQFSSAKPVASRQPQERQQVFYATIVNFAQSDILDGDDGLIPNQLTPHIYGKPVWPMDVDGNGIETSEAHIAFFEGKYWLTGDAWKCGKQFTFGNQIPGTTPAAAWRIPSGDYGADGICGIGFYSSPDLTTWTLENYWQPTIFAGQNITENTSGNAGPGKPQVLWNQAKQQYQLFINGVPGFGPNTRLGYALGPTPAGPWSNVTQLTGPYLGKDFDIAEGPDGNVYVVTNIFTEAMTMSGSTPWDVPVWDFWVNQLKPDLSGAVDTTETMVRIFKDAHHEAVGFFYHDGYYYITSGGSCRNCPAPTLQFRSSSPFGPYEEGPIQSPNGCQGQNKGANQLPSAEGPIVLLGSRVYRTSAINTVHNDTLWHGDNSQAIATTAWLKADFTADGWIQESDCRASQKIPLVENTVTPAPNAEYRVDCRIREHFALVQTYTEPLPSDEDGNIRIPLWQRTQDLGPTAQDGAKPNGPLDIVISLTDNTTVPFSLPASNISWVPQIVHLNVGIDKHVSSILLHSNGTNGCYGVVAVPRTYEAADVWKSNYTLIASNAQTNSLIQQLINSRAQLYVHKK